MEIVPNDILSARTRIVARAEQLFAEFGYEGTPMRLIAREANVPLALVSYHFVNKLGLYHAVFEQRSRAIVAERKRGLASAALEPDPERRLELIVRSLIQPLVAGADHEGREFIETLALRELANPNSARRQTVNRLIDPIAGLATNALRAALPQRTEADIEWAFRLICGAMIVLIADIRRAATRGDDAKEANLADEAVRYLVPLLMDGLRNGPGQSSDENDS